MSQRLIFFIAPAWQQNKRLKEKTVKAMNAGINVDVDELESELRKNVRGEVRFSDGDRALYSTDSSNYRQIPIGVVVPRDRSDVITSVEICRKFGEPRHRD